MKWNIKFECIVDGSDLIDVIVEALSSDRIVVKHREIKEVHETPRRARMNGDKTPMRDLVLREMQRIHPTVMTYEKAVAFVVSHGQKKNSASARLSEIVSAGLALRSSDGYSLGSKGVAASSVPKY